MRVVGREKLFDQWAPVDDFHPLEWKSLYLDLLRTRKRHRRDEYIVLGAVSMEDLRVGPSLPLHTLDDLWGEIGVLFDDVDIREIDGDPISVVCLHVFDDDSFLFSAIGHRGEV